MKTNWSLIIICFTAMALPLQAEDFFSFQIGDPIEKVEAKLDGIEYRNKDGWIFFETEIFGYKGSVVLWFRDNQLYEASFQSNKILQMENNTSEECEDVYLWVLQRMTSMVGNEPQRDEYNATYPVWHRDKDKIGLDSQLCIELVDEKNHEQLRYVSFSIVISGKKSYPSI